MTLKGAHVYDFLRHHVNSLMRQVNRSASVQYLLTIYKFFVSCHIGYVHSNFINLLIDKLKGEGIFNIDRIWRVDCEE